MFVDSGAGHPRLKAANLASTVHMVPYHSLQAHPKQLIIDKPLTNRTSKTLGDQTNNIFFKPLVRRQFILATCWSFVFLVIGLSHSNNTGRILVEPRTQVHAVVLESRLPRREIMYALSHNAVRHEMGRYNARYLGTCPSTGQYLATAVIRTFDSTSGVVFNVCTGGVETGKMVCGRNCSGSQ